MTAHPSELILARLKDQAEMLSRPAIRLASIERLKTACDAIESGGATDIDKRMRGYVAITPSMIEKYVKAKARSGLREWTGPTRVFIAQDPDLKAYVDARENERLKPFQTGKKQSPRHKDIEDAISILPIEMRQILRHQIEEGRLAKRRLDLLSRGLRSMPEVNTEALLKGEYDYLDQNKDQMTDSHRQTKIEAAFSQTDSAIISRLSNRLNDPEEMRRAGLEIDGFRLRMTSLPKTTIIRPEEMLLLLRLAKTDCQ